jgi:hypothetical protein
MSERPRYDGRGAAAGVKRPDRRPMAPLTGADPPRHQQHPENRGE